jgi:hypothetical protein
VAVVGYLAFAILAGAAVETLRSKHINGKRALIVAGLPMVAVAALLGVRGGATVAVIGAIVLVAALVVAMIARDARSPGWAVPTLLTAVVAADLLAGFSGIASRAPYGGFHRVDLETYYAPTGAVAFIGDRGAVDSGRYIGYDRQQQAIADGQRILYRYQFASPETRALLVNNRGTLHGLEDAQGYNPVQPKRFVEYMTALNGHAQEYHDANVYPGGITSPLLDLLNVRYVVIPAETMANRSDLRALNGAFPTIYADDEVQVRENREALPQAWIVHEALQVSRGEALPLLESGAVDPRRTALIEADPPPLAPATNPAAEWIVTQVNDPDRLRLAVSTDAPGLLVLSESYDPGWRAYIDGEEADVLVADHLLRAVPLPAGEHAVELRYEPRSLRVGVAISTVTAFTVIGALLVVVQRSWRDRREAMSTPGDAPES